MTTLADIVLLHAGSRFDLIAEPWIPVINVDGTTRSVGLRCALLEGHLIEDIAAENRLEGFAIARFLFACGLALLADEPNHDWTSVVRDDAPIPEAAVERLLNRLRPHMWLFHPDTPFLQRPELRTWIKNKVGDRDTLATVTDPFATLLPHLPAKHNEVWWYKPGVETTDPDKAAVARALLVRHYAATPGNESVTDVGKVCQGGVMVPGPRDTTQVYWKASTLAATVVTNQLRDHVDRCRSVHGGTFFWEAPDDIVQHLTDPLYLSTASTAASFVVDTDGYPVLRSVIPAQKTTAVALIAAARLSDPLSLRAPKVDGQPVTELNDATTIAFSPEATQFARAYDLYRRAPDISRLLPTVMNRRLLAYPPPPAATLRTGTLTTSGPGAGPRVDGFACADIDPAPLLLEGEQAVALTDVLNRLAADSKSLRSQLRGQIRQALSENGTDARTVQAIADIAQLALWSRTDASLGDIFARIANDPSPTAELTEADRQVWLRAACDAFAAATRPYETSARSISRIVRAATDLRRKSWQTLHS